MRPGAQTPPPHERLQDRHLHRPGAVHRARPVWATPTTTIHSQASSLVRAAPPASPRRMRRPARLRRGGRVNYASMRYVAETCTVQGAGRALLWAIAYRADRDSGECWTALRRLANEAGIGYTTAKRVKPELIDQGELEVVVEGTGRRPACLHITACGPAKAPLADPVSGTATDPQAPVDNFVVGPSRPRSGPIGHPVVGPNGPSPYKDEVKKIEGLEVQPAAAASVSADPTADAVGGHSPNGGVPADATAALATLKAAWHDRIVADRQAQRDRERDLFGAAATEASA